MPIDSLAAVSLRKRSRNSRSRNQSLSPKRPKKNNRKKNKRTSDSSERERNEELFGEGLSEVESVPPLSYAKRSKGAGSAAGFSRSSKASSEKDSDRREKQYANVQFAEEKKTEREL